MGIIRVAHDLPNATCLMRPRSFYVFFVVTSIKDHHNLPHDSPLLKKACVRQVVLDKCFPLNYAYEYTFFAAPLLCCCFFVACVLVAIAASWRLVPLRSYSALRQTSTCLETLFGGAKEVAEKRVMDGKAHLRGCPSSAC